MNLKETETDDAIHMDALRSAVKAGVADFDQERYCAFPSSAELRTHLASVAAKAIAEA